MSLVLIPLIESDSLVGGVICSESLACSEALPCSDAEFSLSLSLPALPSRTETLRFFVPTQETLLPLGEFSSSTHAGTFPGATTYPEDVLYPGTGLPGEILTPLPQRAETLVVLEEV